MISMYYCLRCPSPSFIIFAHHSLFFHHFLSPLLSVCHVFWVKVTCILSVWRGTANRLTVCAYSHHQSSSWYCPDAGGLRPYLFQRVYLFVQTLYFLLLSRDSVNWYCRLDATSASGPPFAKICVAAAAILSRYPSGESSILFVSRDGPMDAVYPCLLSGPFFPFTNEPPITAEPPKGFPSPSLAASARLFATYTYLKVSFHAVQVFWLSGSF